MDTNILYYVILAPFGGFLFNILLGSYVGKPVVSAAGCLAVLSSFAITANTFFTHFYTGGDPLITQSIRWIDIRTFSIDISLYVDRLTIIMMLVVTGVGSLIHIYSVGYMHDDKRFSRYFAFINLFTAFMLLLIMGKNMFMMFVGWEGVGLCSYLLIGFWFDDKEKGISNSLAGMKAFIVNRIGDFSFTIGLLILFTYIGDRFGVWTLDIPSIRETVGKNSTIIDTGVITLVCILLFGGACGKSAQIPLYVWLPDAMAGPTPVSALIHAATMVTAGIYMVVRFNFIYTLSPTAMTVIAVIGALTAFFAATIGVTQFDIKKVLAYSTVSQLGYMFLACGVGAFAAAIFHLVTHAFFKACLFLGAGSVIHGLGGEQDIRHMGGLRKKMPVTFITFAVATFAICGIPPLAGFFSKDEILWKAFSSHLAIGKIVWALGVVTAFITAFYMVRLLILTFYGEYRGHHHVHESPKSMLFALIFLGILSFIGGLVGVPDAIGDKLSLGKTNAFEHFISKSIEGDNKLGFFDAETAGHEGHHSPMEFALMGLSILVAFGGVLVAVVFYSNKPHLPQAMAARWKALYGLIYDKYRVDEAYKKAVISPVISTSVGAGRFDNSVIDGTVNTVAYSTGDSSGSVGVFDNRIVDGMVNRVASDIYAIGGGIKEVQDGNVKMYLTIGVTLSVAIIVSLWTVMEWNTVLDILNRISLF